MQGIERKHHEHVAQGKDVMQKAGALMLS